jgi:hypothetical protein
MNKPNKQTKALYCDYADVLFLSPILGDYHLLMLLSLSKALATCKRQRKRSRSSWRKMQQKCYENGDNKESNPFVHTSGAKWVMAKASILGAMDMELGGEGRRLWFFHHMPSRYPYWYHQGGGKKTDLP